MRGRIVRPVLFEAASACSVWSHSLSPRFGDFYGGLLHPLTALEHVAPLVGLGLFAGQQGRAAGRMLLWLLPAALAMGAVFGMWLNVTEPVEQTLLILLRLTFVLVGALVAGAWPLPQSMVAFIAIAVGLFHGAANTFDAPAQLAAHLYVSGVALAGFTVTALVSALAVSLKVEWQKIALRVLGSWLAAIGILMLGLG